jgi:hypothetical protein
VGNDKEKIVNYGDTGETYYVLFKGSCDVRIPTMVELKLSPGEFLQYCLLNYSEIYWKKTFNGMNIAKTILDHVRMILNAEDRFNSKNLETVRDQILEYFGSDNPIQYQVFNMATSDRSDGI